MNQSSTLRRPLGLVTACERRLRDGYLGRAASVYGWGIATSYGLFILLAPESSRALWSSAMLSASGVVGSLVALATLRLFGADRASDGLVALATDRGVTPAELWLARGGAVVTRLAKTVGLPCAALALLAFVARLLGDPA